MDVKSATKPISSLSTHSAVFIDEAESLRESHRPLVATELFHWPFQPRILPPPPLGLK